MKPIPISGGRSSDRDPMNINWNELEPDDLPAELETIANDFGTEGILVVRYLVQTWGGGSVYIPPLSSVRRRWRDRVVREEFDGSNVAELARRYGISRRHVRNLVRRNRDSDE